jgi:hypothetical protein
MMGNERGTWLAVLAASLALACGGEESKPAPAGGSPAATALAPVEPADMYEWNPTQGAARDLAADSAACQSQVTGQGLAAVAQQIQCMTAKGWQTRPPGS